MSMRNAFLIAMAVVAIVPIAAVSYSVLDHEPSRPRVSSSSHPRAVAEAQYRRAPALPERAVEPTRDAPRVDADSARAAATRVADRITAAEARGAWTHQDMAAISRELDRLDPDDLRAQMSRIGKAIEEHRMTPEILARSQR